MRIFGESALRRLGSLVAVAVTVGVVASATPALGAESLQLAIGAHPAVGEPLTVLAEGAASEGDRLYVYVAAGESCAADPHEEAVETFEVAVLSAQVSGHALGVEAEGELLSAGAFTESYTVTPWAAEKAYEVCAYLDGQPTDRPFASARASFSLMSGVVEAPYLGAASGELNQIAVEHELQEQHEREQRQREREELERVPASEQGHGEPPSFVAPPTTGSRKICLVPALKGLSLGAARAALRRAGCRLGAVTHPGRPRGALVVLRQGARRGGRVRAGTAVAVVLGAPRR
jgi:hypothetical protein